MKEDKKRIIESLVVVIFTTAKLIHEQNKSVMKSSMYRHEAAFINYVISGAQHTDFLSRMAIVNLRSGPKNFMKHLKLFETENKDLGWEVPLSKLLEYYQENCEYYNSLVAGD